MTRISSLSSVFLFVAVPAACGGADPATGTAGGGSSSNAKAPAAAVGPAEAQKQFDMVCFTCHGKTGHGDGPGAIALDPKPRSFADVEWQDSVTDEHISKAITYGGQGVGKSTNMPAHPQYKGKTEMLAALVKIVRGFRGK